MESVEHGGTKPTPAPRRHDPRSNTRRRCVKQGVSKAGSRNMAFPLPERYPGALTHNYEKKGRFCRSISIFRQDSDTFLVRTLTLRRSSSSRALSSDGVRSARCYRGTLDGMGPGRQNCGIRHRSDRHTQDRALVCRQTHEIRALKRDI